MPDQEERYVFRAQYRDEASDPFARSTEDIQKDWTRMVEGLRREAGQLDATFQDRFQSMSDSMEQFRSVQATVGAERGMFEAMVERVAELRNQMEATGVSLEDQQKVFESFGDQQRSHYSLWTQLRQMAEEDVGLFLSATDAVKTALGADLAADFLRPLAWTVAQHDDILTGLIERTGITFRTAYGEAITDVQGWLGGLQDSVRATLAETLLQRYGARLDVELGAELGLEPLLTSLRQTGEQLAQLRRADLIPRQQIEQLFEAGHAFEQMTRTLAQSAREGPPALREAMSQITRTLPRELRPALGRSMALVFEAFPEIAGQMAREATGRVGRQMQAAFAGLEALPEGPARTALFGRMGEMAAAPGGMGAGVFGRMMGGVTGAFQSMGRGVTSMFGGLGKQIMTGLKGAFAPMAFMRVLSDILAPIVAALQDVIEPLFFPIQAVLLDAVNLMRPLIPPLVDMFAQIMGHIAPIFQKLIPPLVEVLAVLMGPLGAILDAIFAILNPFIDIGVDLLKAFMPLLKVITDVVVGLAPLIRAFGDLAELFRPITEGLTWLMGKKEGEKLPAAVAALPLRVPTTMGEWSTFLLRKALGWDEPTIGDVIGVGPQPAIVGVPQPQVVPVGLPAVFPAPLPSPVGREPAVGAAPGADFSREMGNLQRTINDAAQTMKVDPDDWKEIDETTQKVALFNLTD